MDIFGQVRFYIHLGAPLVLIQEVDVVISWKVSFTHGCFSNIFE